MLEELNDYNDKCYMTHFAYRECQAIIDGNVISEDEEVILGNNEHITEIPLYIFNCKLSSFNNTKHYDIIEIPIGTKLKFVKYGDESNTYSSDPVYANCYSCDVEGLTFKCAWLFTDKAMASISFYTKK